MAAAKTPEQIEAEQKAEAAKQATAAAEAEQARIIEQARKDAVEEYKDSLAEQEQAEKAAKELAEAEAAGKLVKIKIHQPLYTNGIAYGFEEKTIDGAKRIVFTGVVETTEEVAKDLEERDATYLEYKETLHRDTGSVGQVSL